MRLYRNITIFFMLIDSMLQAKAFIAEIINNTDATLVIESTRLGGHCNALKDIWVTQMQSENKPFKMNHFNSNFPPRTTYSFAGLNLPNQAVSTKDKDICFISILYKIRSHPSRPIIGFRQLGDLLEILRKDQDVSIRELIISGEKITMPSMRQILREKIVDDAYYSIEIKQVLIDPYNKVFDVIFKRIDSPSKITFASKAEVKIIRFSHLDLSDAVVTVTIGFDKLVAEDFLSKVSQALKGNELIKRVGTVEMGSNQTINVKLYTIITHDDFKKIIEGINTDLLKA